MDLLRVRYLLLWTLASILLSATSRAASASDPLLVVVEVAPGSGVDPAGVRRAIAAELQTSVLAPGDGAAQTASRVLLVAIDGRRISMSLKNAAGLLARTIIAPPERGADLRAVGWLAGNLARDQVSAPIAATAPAPVPPAASDPNADGPSVPTEPPPPPRPRQLPGRPIPSNRSAPKARASRPLARCGASPPP